MIYKDANGGWACSCCGAAMLTKQSYPYKCPQCGEGPDSQVKWVAVFRARADVVDRVYWDFGNGLECWYACEPIPNVVTAAAEELGLAVPREEMEKGGVDTITPNPPVQPQT